MARTKGLDAVIRGRVGALARRLTGVDDAERCTLTKASRFVVTRSLRVRWASENSDSRYFGPRISITPTNATSS